VIVSWGWDLPGGYHIFSLEHKNIQANHNARKCFFPKGGVAPIDFGIFENF
jgi:hypothetical protein